VQGWINVAMTIVIMLSAIIVVAEAFRRWYQVLIKREYVISGQTVSATDPNFTPPEFGCC
jgi:hypothetical protein